jgi:hypothetical protein
VLLICVPVTAVVVTVVLVVIYETPRCPRASADSLAVSSGGSSPVGHHQNDDEEDDPDTFALGEGLFEGPQPFCGDSSSMSVRVG